MGFDQWSTFYGSYTVLGSKMDVTHLATGGTGGPVSNRAGVTASLNSAVFGSSQQETAEEQPYTIAKNATMGAVGAGQCRISQYMSTAKINGVVRAAVQTENDYSALISASPVSLWYWHVWNYTPTGETQSAYQMVKLTYFVVFESRLDLGTS